MKSRNYEALLAQQFLRKARWKGKDQYPSCLEYYAELEGLLEFVRAQGQLDSFWPRLVSERTQERDDALQEIRVARFFESNGFPIAQWEPPGAGNFIGEFSLDAQLSAPIFVEIKSPGWEGELTAEQIAAGRKEQPKYRGIEGGAVGPGQKLRMSVRKAYPKLLPSQPNLLVIADDLFVPIASWGRLPAEQALFQQSSSFEGEPGYFTSERFENLGGVALFKQELLGEGLRYTCDLYPNLKARAETALPKAFVEAFGPP